MRCEKVSPDNDTYIVSIHRRDGNDTIFEWLMWADPSGVAALIRSIDLATNEANLARSIGLKRVKQR